MDKTIGSETPDLALVVMAKAPVPGLAKTRLVPALGERGAARLAQRFLTQTLDQALAADVGRVTLCAAPGARHPAFEPWASDPRLTLEDQAEGDLGQRMTEALRAGLARAQSVLLFGTDAPALDAVVLQQAAAALQRHEAVFLPTLDGGYVLVGLTRRATRCTWERLFADMVWSTPKVMAHTRQRLAQIGLSAFELPALADVDEPEDLVHVSAAWVEDALGA